MTQTKTQDIVIIGGGVTGTALAYTLAEYSDLERITLLEKEEDFAMINSNEKNNSQTLHFGDIETNFTYEKAAKVKDAAELVAAYLEDNDQEGNMHYRRDKLALAVGEEEVVELQGRFDEIKNLYPSLELITEEKIAELEPKVMEGRKEKVAALYSADGYAVDYHKLAASFAEKAQAKGTEIRLNTQVEKVRKVDDHYEVDTGDEVIKAKAVMFATGAHSMGFAKKLGYAQDLTVLPVAGSFFHSPDWLNGKVYRMQDPDLPFAAIHGDHEVHREGTRFGPTAKFIPMLERHHYDSVPGYLKTASFGLKAMAGYAKLLLNPKKGGYMMKNALYDIPFIGKRMFLPEVQKIIPTATVDDISHAHNYGGLRPQIMDVNTGELAMGQGKIEGDNIIFNITPSPGATNCLGNAREDAATFADMLGARFDDTRFVQEHSREQYAKVA